MQARGGAQGIRPFSKNTGQASCLAQPALRLRRIGLNEISNRWFKDSAIRCSMLRECPW